MDTDAIKDVIEQCKGRHGFRHIMASQQLDALLDRIATLEQQLSDEKGICESLRSQNSDAVKEVQKLEKQIQQAERRGYELAKMNGVRHVENADYKIVAMADDVIWRTYEQAIAERDAQDGAK